MKKLLLATLLTFGSMVSMSAEVYLQYKGEKVENGSEIVYDQVISETFEEIPGYVQWTLDPDLYLFSTEEASLSINVTSNIAIQLCTSLSGETGFCDAGTSVSKSPVVLKANESRALLLDAILTQHEENIDIPEYNVEIKISNSSAPANVIYSIKLKMGGFSASAGVESIGSENNLVALSGHNLNYDLPAGSQISVYSLSGKTVLNQTVSGNGSLNLGNLPKGVYLYRVSGKFTKAAKIIIR